MREKVDFLKLTYLNYVYQTPNKPTTNKNKHTTEI